MLENLKIALTEAIEDEYKARATYRLILNKFGAIRPFVNIVESEERHIQALMPLFSKYGIALPEDNWVQRVEVPASVQEACQAGVQAEIKNAQMYQRLLDLTQGYPDVQRVFLNLQSASQNNHLPAFQRGAERRLSSPFPVILGGGHNLIGEEEDTDRGEVVDTKEGGKLTKTRIVTGL